MEQKFFICEVCGNQVAIVKDSGMSVMCCGKKMTELIPETTDADKEKHVPCVEIKDKIVCVRIGATEHPSMDTHHIEWISIHTDKGNQRKELKPGDKPEVCFALLDGEKLQSVCAYCNIHGLWKKEINDKNALAK